MIRIVSTEGSRGPHTLSSDFQKSGSFMREAESEVYAISSVLQPEEHMNGNRLPDALVQHLKSNARQRKPAEGATKKHRVTDEQRLGVFFMQFVYDRTDYCATEIIDIAPYIVKMAKKLCLS